MLARPARALRLPGSARGVSTWQRALPSFMFKQHIVASDDYNRWLVPPAAIGTHMCIGSVYAWSIFNGPLTRELGVVCSSASDWQLGYVVPVFSTSIVALGLSAAFAGKWLEEVGPRLVGTISATCWGGGFLISALGLHLHSLPLVYAGYGVIGGVGLGLGYVSPVSTLLRWFPDRKGMATGMAIMGFGGGAMLAAPLKTALLGHFFRPPTYLGPAAEVAVQTTESGARVAQHAGEAVEVVVATAADVAQLGVDGLAEGVYVVGTGATGAAETFMVLGSGYFLTILAAAFAYRVPREGWAPKGWAPPGAAGGAAGGDGGDAMVTTKHVHIDTALLTPQFYMLWTCLFCNVSAGIGVLAVAKTMMGDIFGSTMPHVVDASFAASYVSLISVANMGGRFVWASASDLFGRKTTFAIFFGAGLPLYLSVPYAAQLGATTEGLMPLALFTTSTTLIYSMYGGGFATIPAYLADIFGTRHVGGIHGRLLTAWASAGIAGPVAVTMLRRASNERAITELARDHIDPAQFEQAFGATTDMLPQLISSNAVTLPRLMAIAPPGTLDPTPMLYSDVMHSCAGLLAVGFLANAAVRPVHPKFHMAEPEEPSAAGADGVYEQARAGSDSSEGELLKDPWSAGAGQCTPSAGARPRSS